jgi:hypothetical protein
VNEPHLLTLCHIVPEEDKGKNKATAETAAESDSDSASSVASDISAISRRRRERRRRRENRRWERMQEKHPGVHRPNCTCPQCTGAGGPPCWSCRAPRNPPPMHYGVGFDVFGRPPGVERQPRRPVRHHRHQRHGGPNNNNNNNNNNNTTPPNPNDPSSASASSSLPWAATDPNGGRISGEDLRTWLLAYELHLDVYIAANKFLLEDLKKEIARAAVDMLETAGSDAAVFEVLCLCRKLYDGLPESDPLLKMVFARVGFLQPWRRAPRETDDFLMANPEIAPLLLREMAARREDDVNGRALPSMVRPWHAGIGGVGGPFAGGVGPGGIPLPPNWVGRDAYGPIPPPGPWYGRVNGRY